MIKHKLSKYELDMISRYELMAQKASSLIEEAKSFELGDILIRGIYREDIDGKLHLKSICKNSYGLKRKYIVAHKDKNGAAYIKELNKDGKPTGSLYSAIEDLALLDDDDRYGRRFGTEVEKFILDSDYADSIILQDEHYSPTDVLKRKSELCKDIVEHNKLLMIRLSSLNRKKKLETLLSFDIGSMIWTGKNKFFTVVAKNLNTSISGLDTILTVQDPSGNLKEWTFGNVPRIIYKDRPRSIKNELDNLN